MEGIDGAFGGGGGVPKLVIFCVRHNCMTSKWPKITTNSITRGNHFYPHYQATKSDTFWLCREQPSAAPYSTDDQNRARATFSWYLIFYFKTIWYIRYSFLTG